MFVAVDKGEKVKEKSTLKVTSIGQKAKKSNEKYEAENPIRIFKRSKFIEADYKEDLSSL